MLRAAGRRWQSSGEPPPSPVRVPGVRDHGLVVRFREFVETISPGLGRGLLGDRPECVRYLFELLPGRGVPGDGLGDHARGGRLEQDA